MDAMGIFLIIVAVVLCLVVIYAIFNPENGELSYTESNIIYISGFQGIEGGKKLNMKILDDKLILEKSFKVIFEADKNRVVDVEIMTESQITKAVTLGRFLTLGLLSVFFQKQKTIYSNFLVITYRFKNEASQQLILKPNNVEKTYKALKDYIK